LLHPRRRSTALLIIAASAAAVIPLTASVASATPAGQPGRDSLSDVAVTSPANAWAVGCHLDAFGGCGRTLIERWNGKTWITLRSPNPSRDSNGLSAITATSGSIAWAVGSANGTPLALHWTGRSWQQVPAGPVPNQDLGGRHDR